MRLVLDHVAQGLLTISAKGEIGDERSRVVDEWLGPAPASGFFSDWVRAHDEKFGAWLDIGLEELAEDISPARWCCGSSRTASRSAAGRRAEPSRSPIVRSPTRCSAAWSTTRASTWWS